MSAEVESIAYAGETPWHGLGVKVSNDMTTDEMLKAANLDWKVLKQPNYFLRPSSTPEKPLLRIVPGEYSLIRDTDEAYLDTVGETFKVPQNADILDFFKRYVEAGDMQMETAGSLKGGKFIWALARINESFSLGKGDETRGYLLLSQPHQFGFSMTAAITPVRVVCWNTINMAGGINKTTAEVVRSQFRMTHAREFDETVKAEIEQTLGLASETMKAFSHTAEMLSQTRAKDDAVTDYFHRVMQLDAPEEGLPEDEDLKEPRTIRKFRENLLSAPGQDLFKETWWNAYNGITYTVDHQLGRTDDNRLHSAWYGQGSALKRRALELAVDYAKAA